MVEVWYCRDSGLLATDACKSDPRGSRVVKGSLAMDDAPTEYCDVHTYVELCDETNQVANEFCSQVEGNGTHTVALLNLNRSFPISGITVADQQYAIYSGSIPSGYYPALSPSGASMGQTCTVHTEESLPPEETDVPEVPTNPTDPTDPNQPVDPNAPVDSNQPIDQNPETPDGEGGTTEPPYHGWEDPANGGVVPDD